MRFNLFLSIHSFQFAHVNSFPSIRSYQFLHVDSFISIPASHIIHCNSFMSIHSFWLFVSIPSLQFRHSNSFISVPPFHFLHFNSFISIHSVWFARFNSFMSIHLLNLTYFNSFNSCVSSHSCHLIHVNSFISCISFHFNSLFPNPPRTPTNHVHPGPLSKLPPRHVPGTTWYCANILYPYMIWILNSNILIRWPMPSRRSCWQRCSAQEHCCYHSTGIRPNMDDTGWTSTRINSQLIQT